MDLQRQLKTFITLYGISKKHIADKLGIPPTELYSWLSGRIHMSDSNVNKVQEYVQLLQKVDGFLMTLSR